MADLLEDCLTEVERLRSQIQRALDEPTQNEHDLWVETKRLQAFETAYHEVEAENTRIREHYTELFNTAKLAILEPTFPNLEALRTLINTTLEYRGE